MAGCSREGEEDRRRRIHALSSILDCGECGRLSAFVYTAHVKDFVCNRAVPKSGDVRNAIRSVSE